MLVRKADCLQQRYITDLKPKINFDEKAHAHVADVVSAEKKELAFRLKAIMLVILRA